jgi:putative ABC transport system permease protein
LEAGRGHRLAGFASAPGKFGFVVLSVAVGVAALVGVRGFSDSFRRTLGTEARSLMAGDLSARLFHEPTAEEKARLRRLRSSRAEFARPG